MKALREIGILAGVTIPVAIFLSFANHVGGAILARDFNVLNVIFVPILMTPVYAAVIFSVGVVLGWPTLIILRKKELSGRVGAMALCGLLLGAFGAAILILFTSRSRVDFLEVGVLGALVGLSLSVLWWWTVERLADA